MSIRKRETPKLGLFSTQRQQKQRHGKAKVKKAAEASGRRRKRSAGESTAVATAVAVRPTKPAPPNLTSPDFARPSGSSDKSSDTVSSRERPQRNVTGGTSITPHRPVPSRRHRRGIDAVTNRVRQYDNRGRMPSRSGRAPVTGRNGELTRQPARPNRSRTGFQRQNRHDHLIKHSKAVFLRHGVGVMGNSSGPDCLRGTRLTLD